MQGAQSYQDVLADREKDFAHTIQCIKPSVRSKAGALLPIIPDHTKWDDFLVLVKTGWENWRNNLQQHPACLVLLYGGLAFYEYEDKELWSHFETAIGRTLPQNQRNDINAAFAAATTNFGLRLKTRSNGTDFIGSAVYHIGIPLSLWEGFLEICEWALWHNDWKTLSDEEWNEVVNKRSGGRQRLKKFLTDNRESAVIFVQELLDAREILSTNIEFTIDDIAQASILRAEYFDEVPETAEFLRPKNPDSLFQDRARLIWNEQRKQICIHLPSVKREKLPATWNIGTRSQSAAPDPDELPLNAEAFYNPLLLTLQSGHLNETKRLCGLGFWGLFDIEGGGRLINSNRDELPLKNYTLISKNEIEIISREGFGEGENPVNEQFELADGTICFITNLWPTGKYAELRIKADNNLKIIRFRKKAKIEANFLVGKAERAAYFERIEDKVKIEQWPILCVSIPVGYFRNNKTELIQKFNVLIDDNLAGGEWKDITVQRDDDREFYFWEWSSTRPIMEKIRSGTVTSFNGLRNFFFKPSLKGDRVLSIKSPEFTKIYKIYKDDSKYGIDKCWKNLPGSFLPMFLLCQSTEGMKWDDLIFAKDIISPSLRISNSTLYNTLRKYLDHGFLTQRGHKWLIKQSRSALKHRAHEQCRMDYCGDPSILWGLYRYMYHKTSQESLPTIEVIDEGEDVPYLQMTWPLHLHKELKNYLNRHHVIVGTTLWTH